MATNSVSLNTFTKASVIRGFHVYGKYWSPYIGENLVARQEDGNQIDKFAVAIYRENEIVGHVPREISKIVWHFIKHGGAVNITVTGNRRHSSVAGGLEVPCSMEFGSSDSALLQHLETLLKH